ncbi:MAG: endonuclease domain-containing protein [Myxococcota bacterium]
MTSYNKFTLVELARRLRQDQTDAERLLWQLLRNRQVRGKKFRRQYQVGRYLLDFYCHEAQLVVELDGGGHAMPEQQVEDGERDAFLRSQGLRVLRLWNHQVLQETEAVLTKIWDELG